MDALHDLLNEIRRLQLLVCTYSREANGAAAEFPFEQVTQGLRISPEECGTVVRRLSLEGLVEPIHSPGMRGPRAVRLTAEGRQVLEAMGGAPRHGPMAMPPASA